MTSAAATAWPPASADAASSFSGRPLPRAGHVLAVTARPGPESADLGALLYAFRRRGASLALLTLTRGEASPVNSTCERLEDLRPWELQVSAGLLGITSLTVADYPDGALHRYPPAELAERVRRAIRAHAADLLLVVDPAGSSACRDPASGPACRDPADAAVARAVCAAAEQAGVPVLARMPRPARYGWHVDLGPAATAARLQHRVGPDRDQAAVPDQQADPGVLADRQVADPDGIGGRTGRDDEAVQALGLAGEPDAQTPRLRLDGAQRYPQPAQQPRHRTALHDDRERYDDEDDLVQALRAPCSPVGIAVAIR